MKHVLQPAKAIFRKATACIRKRPNFVIVGAQRAGTTSLFAYLTYHPRILSPIKKELHFFDFHYQRGICWYRSCFPLTYRNIITGEASPYYLYHPFVPERMKTWFPHMYIIILLRDPVERAFSHYCHEVRKNRETLSFCEAIRQEEKRLNMDRERFYSDPSFSSIMHHRFSYIDRGKYVQQLDRWFEHFPENQIHLLKSIDLFENAQKTVSEVFDFVGVEDFVIPTTKQYGSFNKQSIDEDARAQLQEYFRPYNEELKQKYGISFQ